MPTTLQPAPIPSFRSARRRRRTKLVAAVAGLALLVPIGFGIADAVDRWTPDPPAAQTVDRSPAALLLAMRDIADFHAASGTYQVLVDVEHDSPYLPPMISGERSTPVRHGQRERPRRLLGSWSRRHHHVRRPAQRHDHTARTHA